MKLNLIINEKEKSFEISPDEFLSDVLRRFGYVSIRPGCDTGSCGLCTVWLDERPVLSCSVLAAGTEGRKVTTIEGLQKEATEFAEFLVGEGAEQCGYCSPGFIMTVLAMKKELANPSEEGILLYLAGNLCRCSGYEGQMRAILKYLNIQKN